jgi:hypothetical protein
MKRYGGMNWSQETLTDSEGILIHISFILLPLKTKNNIKRVLKGFND